jgi:hypothetical protein
VDQNKADGQQQREGAGHGQDDAAADAGQDANVHAEVIRPH